MIFTFNQFEEKLHAVLENRVDFLKDRFKNIVEEKTFNRLLYMDPTKKKIYLQWIINMYLKSKIRIRQTEVRYLLETFDEYKFRLAKKDINKYTSPDELQKALDNLGGTGRIKKDENYLLNDKYYINNMEAKLYYEDNDYLVVIPKTDKASHFYGSHNWCTTYANEEGVYATLYIIIDKHKLNTNDVERRIQFCFEHPEFGNYENKQVTQETYDKLEKCFQDIPYYKLLGKIGMDYIRELHEQEYPGFYLSDLIWEYKGIYYGIFKDKSTHKFGIADGNGVEVVPPIYDNEDDVPDDMLDDMPTYNKHVTNDDENLPFLNVA